MRLTTVFVAFLAASSSVEAQQIMDGSTYNVSTELLADAFAQLISTTPDPYAAQLIGLKYGGDDGNVVCGMINLKGDNGAYQGFKPFSFDKRTRELKMPSAADCKAP
ncbi:MAG TPA: hypothetical protein VGC14_02090 [Rhizobium sp.]